MIEMIKCPQQVNEKTQWTAFLAGPMNGAPSWQAQAPKVAAKVGIENLTLLNPRKTERFVTSTYQVNWETFGLRMCDVILFWIPPQARDMKPWRYYAITTRLEMAENLARGHKVIIGIDLGNLSRQIQANTNRNQTLMEHWTQTVAPGDTVYVDGEFGAEEWKPFLNGNIL